MNMTNFEKFKKEIAALNYDFGVTETQEICLCEAMICTNCIFNDREHPCDISKIQWLYEEAKEIFPITPQEKDFLSVLFRDNYIARDHNGELFIYSIKPNQISDCWIAGDEEDIGYEFKICPDFFEFITWESDKCWSVAELLEMPMKE